MTTTLLILLALTVIAIAGAVVNVIRTDGRSFHRPPSSHFLDSDFVAPRDRMTA